ncbi:MAG: hypothetical protein ACRBB2_07270 [Nitrosopumilus sp.]
MILLELQIPALPNKLQKIFLQREQEQKIMNASVDSQRNMQDLIKEIHRTEIIHKMTYNR